MYNAADPETITQEKISFDQVNDDVNALSWLPGSATNMLAATRDSLLFCDIRAHWTKKYQIEERTHMHIFGISFDPFDGNRFATISDEMIKVYDLRID